jgi:hypothetical protein
MREFLEKSLLLEQRLNKSRGIEGLQIFDIFTDADILHRDA